MNCWQKSGGLKLEDTQAVGLRGLYNLTADHIAQNFMQVPADCVRAGCATLLGCVCSSGTMSAMQLRCPFQLEIVSFSVLSACQLSERLTEKNDRLVGWLTDPRPNG